MVNDNTKAFVVGGKAYVIDGVKLWVYDPSNNEWNQLNDFPGSLRYHATGFVLNQKIYYGTGSILDVYPSTTTTGLSDLWCYNPSDNTWKRLTDLPRGLYAGFGFSYGGKGYIGGGITYMMQRNIYEYDPALDQ
jgi:N-acetylneuraminic acid mutarotase